MFFLKAIIATQELLVYQDDKLVKTYAISTAKNGAGEVFGSEQTPRGLHQIRAKIGRNVPPNTVFVKRRPTGEIYSPELKNLYPDRDWILTRIFWLSGLEVGKNRLGKVDTMRRYIYIHGTPDDTKMGQPGSKGCIRMRNHDLIEMFNIVPCFTSLLIQETLDS
ncbi:MAG: L,D-transpeptidase [Gammaproteobacteria bacterium]|nr:L,D-transpeptidase [Gammaproteobacteria bacterium]